MFENVIEGIFSAAFLASMVRVTTPILLPSMGALLSDRAGVINIGLEGIMLASAFSGVIISVYTPAWFGAATGRLVGPWLGLGVGVIIGVLMALLLGFFHLKLNGNIILGGIALNILGSSASVAIMYEITGDKANTASLSSLQMPFIQLPAFIARIPLVGQFIYDVLNNQSIMTWIAFLSVGVVWYLLFRTPFGKHLRASGEHPEAAESVGIKVIRTRYAALALSGIFAALGGIHMSMGYLNLFQRDMTAGRGFIALATPLLGGNHPVGTGLASLVFGFFDTFAIRIGSLQIPSQIPQMIPYLATVMALVVYAVQNKTNLRLRALRAAEGEQYDATFWRAIQRLSILHIAVAMIAVIGIIIGISMLTMPHGFQGPQVAYPLGTATGLLSIVFIITNVPYIIDVERISRYRLYSGIIIGLSLGVCFGLFLAVIMAIGTAMVIGLAMAVILWLGLGGWYLLRQPRLAATPGSIGG
ncbi:MAG: ABC transporter permease [Anaerolineae bacterium]|nr:ABC transporter permease [Anaerolineae bacterium]